MSNLKEIRPASTLAFVKNKLKSFFLKSFANLADTQIKPKKYQDHKRALKLNNSQHKSS